MMAETQNAVADQLQHRLETMRNRTVMTGTPASVHKETCKPTVTSMRACDRIGAFNATHILNLEGITSRRH